MGVRFSLPAPYSLLLVILFFSSSLLSAEPVYSPPGIFHEIQAGQTLWSIARSYEVDILELMKFNRLSEPSLIYGGRYIFIPGAKGSLILKEGRLEEKKEEDYKDKGDFRFSWPVKGKLISFFGFHGGRRRQGIKIACPKRTEVKAAEDGIVASAGLLRGYGNIIIIDHPHDYYTIYAHNDINLISRGQTVKKGERIALAGNTGRTDEPCLYFEIRQGTKALNPLSYLPP